MDVIEALTEVNGVSESRAEEALRALADHGYSVVSEEDESEPNVADALDVLGDDSRSYASRVALAQDYLTE